LKKTIFKILLLVFIANICIIAQTDSVKFLEQKNDDTVFVMKKSPWGAVLRSAVIPGWGQYYNESYWKVPVVWGVTAWFVGNWIYNNNQYKDYGSKYNAVRYLSTTDPVTAYNKQLFLTYRDFYRDQRDLFAIYMGIAYLLTLVDAYVDAHMFDFTVKEDFITKSPFLKMNFKYSF
jgi:hypothetical protein